MTCGKKVEEKCKKYWKSQGISQEEKSGNPDHRLIHGVGVTEIIDNYIIKFLYNLLPCRLERN